MDEKDKDITIGVNVEGTEQLQDTVDLLQEVMPNITIRNNREVNVHISVCAVKGENEQADA